MSSDAKLPLPAFLKVFTNANMPMPKAMALASKVYKTYDTPTQLGKLTDAKLVSLGVKEKDVRKTALAAIKKAGYKSGGGSDASTGVGAGSSKVAQKSSPKKRKRDDDLNEFLPSGPSKEGAKFGSFEFNEVLDEESLRTKASVINRAPVMTAWATVVAEQLGFKREEALSIASAYTEMNAISKGVSIGIFNQGKGKGIELLKGESQPYVDLMGRRIPVYTTQSSEWRALVKGEPVDPASAFSYMTRSFRQTLPFVLGSMRLLAETFGPAELNEKGFGLYAEFRPDVDGWGKRAELRCANILGLRKVVREERKDEIESKGGGDVKDVIGVEQVNESKTDEGREEPVRKKAKQMTVEEYEAALDETETYDDLVFADAF